MCSAADAFVVVWAFCVAGVTFDTSKDLPVLGYGVRALQNLYVPTQGDRTKQQNSMVELIKERCVWRSQAAAWRQSCLPNCGAVSMLAPAQAVGDCQ